MVILSQNPMPLEDHEQMESHKSHRPRNHRHIHHLGVIATQDPVTVMECVMESCGKKNKKKMLEFNERHRSSENVNIGHLAAGHWALHQHRSLRSPLSLLRNRRIQQRTPPLRIATALKPSGQLRSCACDNIVKPPIDQKNVVTVPGPRRQVTTAIQTR